MSEKIDYLAEKISKQSVDGASWFLLMTHSKMPEKKNYLNIELLSKEEQNLKIWKEVKKEEVKLSLFAYDMIIYAEYPKGSTKKF